MSDPRSAVAAYFAAANALDVEALVGAFAPEGTVHDPASPAPVHRREALRAFYQGVAGLFSSLEIRADGVIAAGRYVAARFNGRGVGRSGREVSFSGIDVFEVDATGRILNLWGYWDPAAVAAALG